MHTASRWFLSLFFLACALPAQIVRVANFSGAPYAGWKRTTIDIAPPHLVGRVGDVLYVVGRQVGLDVAVVDLKLQLAAGEERSIDLATAEPATFALGQLPPDPIAHFGGLPTFAGAPLELVGLQPDGAAWSATFRGRSGPLVVGMLWLPWYPDQPGWAQGEFAAIASNPAVSDMVATAPPNAYLRFGSAYTILPGRWTDPFLNAGDTFADGQGRVAPLTFVWLQHLRRESDWSSAGAAAHCLVAAVGISKVWADGNPTYPASFDARRWTIENFPESVRRLWTWDPPVIGPSIRSTDSGAQEGQFWTRGEPMHQVGAEWVLLCSALKVHGERPCNHHEATGEPLDLDRHTAPQLLFWDGRPHTNPSANPAGLLGKPRALIEGAEAHGRYGPDNQHFLARTLTAAARYTGSPAAQYLLGQMARAYLLQRTAEPGWSTSGLWSQREVGYEAEFVVDVHFNLEDRALAGRVVQRWQVERATRTGATWWPIHPRSDASESPADAAHAERARFGSHCGCCHCGVGTDYDPATEVEVHHAGQPRLSRVRAVGIARCAVPPTHRQLRRRLRGGGPDHRALPVLPGVHHDASEHRAAGDWIH